MGSLSSSPNIDTTISPSRMPGVNVTGLLSNTIALLEATTSHYHAMGDGPGLPEAFYEAGRGLLLVSEALRTVEAQSAQHDLHDPPNAIASLEACNEKAQLSEGMLKIVSQAPETSRFERYKAVVGREGRENMMEVLVKGMMEDTCDLARDGAIEAAMKGQVERLVGAIEKLSTMEPSVPDRRSGYTFSNYGTGNQFNAPAGTQNNNMSSGNQFPGATFSGAVHFGSRSPPSS